MNLQVHLQLRVRGLVFRNLEETLSHYGCAADKLSDLQEQTACWNQKKGRKQRRQKKKEEKDKAKEKEKEQEKDQSYPWTTRGLEFRV